MSYNKSNNKTAIVYDELAELEKHGVSLWLKGKPSNPAAVSKAVCLNEDAAYMRDYLFENGKVSSIHFDKVLSSPSAKNSRHTRN